MFRTSIVTLAIVSQVACATGRSKVDDSGGADSDSGPTTFTVTGSAATGGTISPASVEVEPGNTTSVTVTANTGFQISSVTGCNGSLVDSAYTTGPITADCTIQAVFTLVVEPSPCLEPGNNLEDCGGLLPSRLEGVAPLYVFFEPDWGEGVSMQAAFHTYQIDWDFGDGDAGTWATTGGAKRTHRGPFGAHIFETPGTFVTTAVLRTPEGDEITQTATIVVQDPNQIFAGESTVCVSKNGNFDDAPAGCKQVTTDSSNTAASHVGSGVRLLFRRGETWSGARFDINHAGPGHIGAFGAGENPIFEITGAAFRISDDTPLADDWRITDITLQGNSPTNAVGVAFEGEATNLLVQRLKMRDVHVGIKASISILDHLNSVGKGPHAINDSIALVEIDLEGILGGSGGNGIYFVATRAALMGNRFFNSLEAEHIWRIPLIDKAVLLHNDLGGANPTKSVVKLHAPGFTDSGLGNGRHTQFVQLADNIFRGGVESWTVNLGPQNQVIDQRLRDAIVERNHFFAGPDTQVMTNFWSQYITVRNNLMDATGSDALCFEASQRGVEPPPKEIHIYNNTCFSASGEAQLARIGGASDSSLRNNLAVSFAEPPVLGSVGSNVQSNNILTQTNVFVGANPFSPADFVPSAASAPNDAGMKIDGLSEDFLRNARGNAPDVGAFEN